ncbi:hypothetical protein [Rufibacter immobilis]|uniref:hypothetical protein n=1 Tax=Rufibacter immobilis TaxID=1348778 RepID=UPI0035EB6CB5
MKMKDYKKPKKYYLTEFGEIMDGYMIPEFEKYNIKPQLNFTVNKKKIDAFDFDILDALKKT